MKQAIAIFVLCSATYLSACSETSGDNNTATGTDIEVSSDLDEGSNDEANPVPVVVERAPCDTYVGGVIELSTDTAYEAFPGYDEELAALDLDALPKVLDMSTFNGLERSLVAFMLERNLDTLPETLDRDAVAAVPYMGPAVLGAFAEAARLKKEGVDLPFLRRGLHRYYQCVRAFPMTLDGFKKAIYDFDKLKPYELESFPKNTRRRLRDDHEAQVYIAETLVDGVVRETEIILGKTRTDGALDFLAYEEAGNLADRGEFATASGANVTGASPYTCIACHFEKDPSTFKINVVFPIM